MRLVVLLVVRVLCLETEEGRLTRSAHLLTQWVRNPSPWKFELEGALGHLVSDTVSVYSHFLTSSQIEGDELSKVARVFTSLGPLPGDVQKSIMTACFPKLCDVWLSSPHTLPPLNASTETRCGADHNTRPVYNGAVAFDR